MRPAVHVARFIAGATDIRQLPKLAEPEIAFAGRSNVGKSSLLNRLVGIHKLARVGKTPGRTQQINFFRVDERVTFVDLPGYGFARVPLAVKQRWKQLVETYLTERNNLRAVVVLVDLRRLPEAEDLQLLDFLKGHQIDALVVATKADKLAWGARQTQIRALQKAAAAHGEVIICSAVTGDGVHSLWNALTVRLG